MNRHLGKSIGAVIAGFLVIVILSVATDQVLHTVRFYPPWGEPMSHGMSLVALGYRTVYSVLGAWLTAWLAPGRPMQHALVLGALGLLGAGLGAAATVGQGLGPDWYPLSLVVLALPQCWAGGRLRLSQLGA